MAKRKKSESSASELNVPLFQGIDLDIVQPVEDISVEQAERESFEVVDFSKADRPLTCLEVDFPILQVNEIAAIESNNTKPIYTMSKWWARRRATVFRQLLIAAALKSPEKESKAAQFSWSQMYRKSHQRHKKFSDITLLDIFMGGGTTVVEAVRLGFKVIGVDLNPIAWWIVRNEVEPADPKIIQEFAQYLKEKVQPEIAPYFTAKSPRGFHGKWIDKKTGNEASINSLKLKPWERHQYDWQGPETIYTFWMKHIMCMDPACFHLTPQANSSIIAKKSLKVKYLPNCVCPKCGDVFDLEFGDFRMAPTGDFVLGENEQRFAVLKPDNTKSQCPHCSTELSAEWLVDQERKKGKPKSKDADHTLLLPVSWLKGVTATSKDQFGGYYGSSDDSDTLWFAERKNGLKLIEVRGTVPKDLLHSNFEQKKAKEGADEGDSASSGMLRCSKCGRLQDPLSSIKLTGHLARIFPYAIQGFDPAAKEKGFSYGGRFFDIPDLDQVLASFREYNSRPELKEWVPTEELFYGYKTHFWGIPDHGYTHWYKMFNPRQLLVHSSLLRALDSAPEDIAPRNAKSQILGAFQNYLRQNCMFTFWNVGKDHLVPHLSNNNYHPKATAVENSVFPPMGTGNMSSCLSSVMEGMEYCKKPFDLRLSRDGETGKSQKQESEDRIKSGKARVICASSTDLRKHVPNDSVDLVITDPPFGDNINYAELADFFLVWLHKPLAKWFGEEIGVTSSESPKTLEAVTNKARHPGKNPDGKSNADLMYMRLLAGCWKEAYRVLKPGGLMAFTFHHDKDVAWIGVLESLFESGFEVVSAFPVRSDTTQGGGAEFGSQKIEFDIVHVCRKRNTDREEIYWATLRRQILESVKAKGLILAQHRVAGLHLADLEVIIRGEVLEQFSRYYGKVKKNLAGEPMSVREILIEANSIAQALLTRSEGDRIPDSVDAETRILLSLFSEGPTIEFDAARKRLRGSGVTLEELVEYGWVEVKRNGGLKSAHLVPISERWNSISRKRSLNSDIDQTHFAINCCLGDRQLDGKPADWEEWIGKNFKSLIPSVGPLLKFMESNHFGSDYKQAIGIAYRTLERTLQRIKESDGEFKKASEQMSLFGN